MTRKTQKQFLLMLLLRSVLTNGLGEISFPVLFSLFVNLLSQNQISKFFFFFPIWIVYVVWSIYGDRRTMCQYKKKYYDCILEMQNHYLKAAMNIELQEFQKTYQNGKLMELLDDGLGDLIEQFEDFYRIIARGLALFGILIIVGVFISWSALLGIIIICILVISISAKINKKEQKQFEQAFSEKSKLQYAVNTFCEGKESYQSAGLIEYWKQYLCHISKSLWNEIRTITRNEVWKDNIMFLAKIGIQLLTVVLFAGKQTINISILSVPISYIVIYEQLDDLIKSISGIQTKTHILSDLNKIDEITNKDSTIQERGVGISYIYANHVFCDFAGNTILNNIDFSYSFGKPLLIVGDNGSGKSTLLKIFSGLMESSSGDVTIDGIKIHDLACNERVIRYPYLPAKPVTLSSTGREFITLTSPMRENAESNGLLDKIPLDSPMSQLSEGEKQRVAIQCIYMKKPNIAIWDEPTSHLDLQTAGKAWKLMASMNSVIVMHNFSGFAEEYDPWILWISEGRIKAEGIYSDLMSRNTEFSEWYCNYKGHSEKNANYNNY